MENNQYIAVSGLSTRDKLFKLTPNKIKKFELLFGELHGDWTDHEKAVDWILNNGKFVSFCICVTP